MQPPLRPQNDRNLQTGRDHGDRRRNLSTPNSVQKLQTALHAKAKADGYSRLMGEDEAGTARAVREHRTATIKAFTPVGRIDGTTLYGEPLPPGLVLDADPD